MPSAIAAECILALVAAPERAASTVGDLLEERSRRGRLWFWSSVLRTAASYVWQDLRTAKGRMLVLAIQGLFETGLAFAALGLIVIPLWVSLWPYTNGLNSIYIPPRVFYTLLIAGITVIPILVGWDRAKNSQGRELAAGLSIAGLYLAVNALQAVLHGSLVSREDVPIPYTENFLELAGWQAFFVMTGALLHRLRAVRRSRPVPDRTPAQLG
jgi:hypothetical protein